MTSNDWADTESHYSVSRLHCSQSLRAYLKPLFPPLCRYEMIMEAFGGNAYGVVNAGQLASACRAAFQSRQPTLINVNIDPFAGVESGNVHAFNAPKSKM